MSRQNLFRTIPSIFDAGYRCMLQPRGGVISSIALGPGSVAIEAPATSYVESPTRIETAPEEAAPVKLVGKMPVLVEAESLPKRLVFATVAAGIVFCYFTALMMYWVPAHYGVDQNGYLVGG